jgi:excinuclease ABC subunit A
MGGAGCISLRGVAVHNLKGIDLDLPRGKLIVLCGLSGSGKSSLAIDTLYAEGQRRYIESFSPYARQFLQRLEKPEAERIDGIPPAIAVTGGNLSRSSRATVATATEISDYLQLLFAKIGRVFCRQCGEEVHRDTAESVAERLAALPSGTRFLIALPAALPEGEEGAFAQFAATLRQDGFTRLIVGERIVKLSEETPSRLSVAPVEASAEGKPLGATVAARGAREKNTASATPIEMECRRGCYVIVDRLTAGESAAQRIRDSLELAFAKGAGRCSVFMEMETAADYVSPTGETKTAPPTLPSAQSSVGAKGSVVKLDGRPWRRLAFSSELACADCGIPYPLPEPRLFSFNSPLGACPACKGFGNIIGVDMDLVVPDPNKSLREGAIAPWNSPAYAHELEELLEVAKEHGVPVDVPFRELPAEALKLIMHGAPERNFGGLEGFFAWLERRKYKMHVRVFLSRWRSYRVCAACGGARLRPEALDTRIGGRNIAEIHAMKVSDAAAFFRNLSLSETDLAVARLILEQLQARLHYLEQVGLGYLTLDRTLRTLSGGEARRVALTAALGSSLVNMLYVLDEPSIGLHPRDIERLLAAVLRLRDRGNTVVVVEHEEVMIRAADQVVEIGPGAGERGGRICFQGTPAEMLAAAESLTGEYLSGRRGNHLPTNRRTPDHGWLRLAGARGHNLKHITVEFPLGVLCVVTGVSGSGKSTLVAETLYPALCRRLRKEAPKPLPYDDILGDGQLDDVILVDQSPIGRSPRCNPVTFLKVFDEIRAVFAATPDARLRNYSASHFSFNLEEGRCEACRGDGYLEIDMQFLADVYMRCPQCHGHRYRDEILEVTYRGRNIAEVLEMTVREAFTFFRGQPKVQARLKRLIDVGLDYLQLGQPANTLSGGEAQRLKLAAYMSAARRGRCLFILDEPTTGLHYADIVQLLDCFEALLAVGHSLIVVEHNLQLLKAADYIIDLGPGAAEEGGRIVAEGTPEMVARNDRSLTGSFLAKALAEARQGSRVPPMS